MARNPDLVPNEKRTWKKKLAKILAGAVLAAGIFGSRPAKAEDPPPPPRPRIEETYSVTGGFRTSLSQGLSLDLLSQSLHYSGLSYQIGDQDFTLRMGRRDVGVIDFLEHHDYSDKTKIGDLVGFSRALLESLGVDRPGNFSHRLRASFEGFGEGYGRYDTFLDRERYTNEVGLSAYALARGRAYLDLNINYDNPVLPLLLDADMRAGYHAEMLSRIDLGMESSSSRPFGFGMVARKYADFSSYGWVNSEMHFSLASGFDAAMEGYSWRRRVEGAGFLPYLTLSFRHDGIRHYLNAGPNVMVEHEEEKSTHRSAHNGRSPHETRTELDTYRIRVAPAVGYVMAFENAGPAIPVFSFSNRDSPLARGTLGLHLGRAFVSGSADTSLNASSEMFLLLGGSVSRNDLRDYLVENEIAATGFFPSSRSRMMANRHRLITSSEKLLFRSALSYDREFSELSAENGVILNRRRYFIDSGVRLFAGENFGAGLYNNVGNRNIYFSQSYSSSIGGSGPRIQTVLLSLGGTFR